MNRIRNRLIAVFLAATLVPLAATWWIATALLEHSVGYSSTDRLDRLSKTLEKAGRELYQQARAGLKADAAAGRIVPERYLVGSGRNVPDAVADFAGADEPERVVLSPDGSRMTLYVRRGAEVLAYTRAMTGIDLAAISNDYRSAREEVAESRGRDLGAGLVRTFALLAATVWLVSLALLIYFAHRVSRPLQRLTAGLAKLAEGDLSTRVPGSGGDESGRAIQAFNHMAEELERSQAKLVYLTQLASWRLLARKMAHELKNSLTPIRLTMEEIVARREDSDQQFIEQAARIVVDEVEGLERRVRAFSEFSAEPPVRSTAVNVNALVADRIAFLNSGHPDVRYTTRLGEPPPLARADEDLVKGILTNLLENGADAAGPGGALLVATSTSGQRVTIEVHDSGPGLSEQAKQSLFEPTISFKKRGMGLGLSIVRKNALLSGGDVELIPGELGGAGFRVILPAEKRS